ncbi:hypothetical protein TWF718_009849 [Orbilia javanica]|uniref:T6SS Phospholipase effector Tle1-like catalytic domain-containing protein n=1 Tax=Orbilia javanica TaxID=47235 RepID=A0AAN8RLQ5_9PEZI
MAGVKEDEVYVEEYSEEIVEEEEIVEDEEETGDQSQEDTQSQPPPIPKRIIILCDGTSQSAVSGKKSSPSNIARLARSIRSTARDEKDPSKTWVQLVWYDSGVGTTSSWVGKKIESTLGHGLEGNIIEAYNFVALNYNPGDQILCFGFSRGAYTARSIAGLISDIGICGVEYLHEFPELWDVYTDEEKRAPGERFCGSQAYFDFIDGELADERLQPDIGSKEYNGYNYFELNWKQKPHFWMEGPNRYLAGSRKVDVVGVYDTVGGLGMPGFRHYHPFGNGPKFHNVDLNRNIRHAYHALALDEHRDAFSPTLYSVPTEVTKSNPEDVEMQRGLVEELRKDWFDIVPSKKASAGEKAEVRKRYIDARKKLLELEENSLDESELQQVWFPGMHINIGGGSNNTLVNKGDLEETSNIVFAWMLDKISKHVGIDSLRILSDNFKIKNLVEEHNRQVELAELARELDAEAAKTESWSQSAWRLGRYLKSVATSPFTTPPNNNILPEQGWGTGGYVESYTLMYKANGSTIRTPGKYNNNPNKSTNEEIHPIVGHRMQRLGKDYEPLENKVRRRPTEDAKGWEYTINGVALPEYKLPPPQQTSWTYERLLITEDAKDYVKELDTHYGYPDEPHGLNLIPSIPTFNRNYGEAAVL